MKCYTNILILMVVMCWASQSLAQPTRAIPNQAAATPHKVGVCQAINRETELYPSSDAGSYVYEYMNKEFGINPDGTERTDITERIIEQPKHGRIILDYVDSYGDLHPGYRYVPDANYFDYNIYPDHEYDYFIMEAKTADITVQVYYTMSVRFDAETYTYDEHLNRIDDISRCPNGEHWEISTIIPLAHLFLASAQPSEIMRIAVGP